MLFSRDIKQKTSDANRGQGKPILGCGFIFPILSPFAFLGKGVGVFAMPNNERFGSCNVCKIWETLESVWNCVRVSLSVASTKILGRVGETKVRACCKYFAMPYNCFYMFISHLGQNKAGTRP